MLLQIHPILPMRNKLETQSFYVDMLGFQSFDPDNNWESYLMLRKDAVELHFSLKENLIVANNDCSCYIRTDHVEEWYNVVTEKKLDLAKELQNYPWQQKEFVLRDPNYNHLIFGESL